MQFNLDKYDAIRTTNKRNPLTNKYYVHDTELQTVKDAKYLGVTVSLDLSWNKHVDNTVKKSHNKLKFPETESTPLPYWYEGPVLQFTREAHIRVLFLCM